MTLGVVAARVLATKAWLAVALCWWAQVLLPWTSGGLLSRSTFADAVILVRTGEVDAAVPSVVIAIALVAPVAGVLLAALAGVPGRAAVVARGLLALAGGGVVVAAVAVVPEAGAGPGLGAVVALVGVGLAVACVALDVARVVLDARAPGSGRSVTATFVALGLVTALCGASYVGWRVTNDELGAATPQEAAVELLDAIRDGDGVAVLALVTPEEVGTVVDAYLASRDRLGGGPGAGVAEATSLTVEDPQVQVETLDGDRARATLVGGGYTLRVDPDALPGPLRVLQAFFPDGRISGDLGDLGSQPLLGFFLDGQLSIALEVVDGRWYVTGLGTAVDHVTDVLLGDLLARPDLAELPGAFLDLLDGD